MMMHGIDLQALYDAPDAVIIDSGRQGHGKLLYAMPDGLVLPSKKMVSVAPDGTRYNFIDFRCGTSAGMTVQDILPPSIHPMTMQPYRWAGRGRWEHLPAIPAPLLEVWQGLVDQDNKRSISVAGSVSASWDEIKAALDHISPDCSRDEWVQVGMALHHAGTVTDQLDEALTVWDDWSAQSVTKYKGQHDLMTSWRSYKPDGGVTLGTLFHIASKGGWKRPVPDVSTLFAATAEQVSMPDDLLSIFHIPPPEPDLDHFPPLLVSRAKQVSEAMACDPLVPIYSGLAAVCAVVDARTRLELAPGWRVPPVLWLMTIGKPAAKKTPGSRPMLEILKKLELEDRPRYAAELLRWEGDEAAYTASKKAYIEASRNPANVIGGKLDLTSVPPVLGQPPKPIPLRYTVSDVTSQMLVRMCAARPQGVLCHLDEMNSWANKLTNAGSGDHQSTWTRSYEADSETMDRVGDGKGNEGNSIIADNFAVSIYGNMQPKVFNNNLEALSRDGLMQRFIPAILRSGNSGPGKNNLRPCPQWESVIRVISALPPMNYDLSPEAYELFRAHQHWYCDVRDRDELLHSDDAYMTALGKIEGQTGRIILIWHLLVDPYEQYVSAATASRAIAFVQSYVVHALRYAYGEVGGLTSAGIETWVIEYVLQHAGIKPTITLSEIRRAARRQIEGVPHGEAQTMIVDVMDFLEQGKWVATLERAGRSITWAIDPRVAQRDTARRDAVLRARQQRYNDIHRISGGVAPLKRAKGWDGPLGTQLIPDPDDDED
jgi:hypothetical protein